VTTSADLADTVSASLATSVGRWLSVAVLVAAFLVAREEAVDSEPETVSARSAEVVTVVPETFLRIADLTVPIFFESVAWT
jgi:Na+-driven multidrug efflux pump